MLPAYSATFERTDSSSVLGLVAHARNVFTTDCACLEPGEDFPPMLLLDAPEETWCHTFPQPADDRETTRLACAVIPKFLAVQEAQSAVFVSLGWGVSADVSDGSGPRPSEHPQREENVFLIALDRDGNEHAEVWLLRRHKTAAPTLEPYRPHEENNESMCGIWPNAMRAGLGQYEAARLAGDYEPKAARPRVLGYSFSDQPELVKAEERLQREALFLGGPPTARDPGTTPIIYCPVTSAKQEELARRVLGLTGDEVPVTSEYADGTLKTGTLIRPLMETGDVDALRWLNNDLLDELPPLRPRVKVGRNQPCPCGAAHPDGRPIKAKRCCQGVRKPW